MRIRPPLTKTRKGENQRTSVCRPPPICPTLAPPELGFSSDVELAAPLIGGRWLRFPEISSIQGCSGGNRAETPSGVGPFRIQPPRPHSVPDHHLEITSPGIVAAGLLFPKKPGSRKPVEALSRPALGQLQRTHCFSSLRWRLFSTKLPPNKSYLNIPIK